MHNPGRRLQLTQHVHSPHLKWQTLQHVHFRRVWRHLGQHVQSCFTLPQRLQQPHCSVDPHLKHLIYSTRYGRHTFLQRRHFWPKAGWKKSVPGSFCVNHLVQIQIQNSKYVYCQYIKIQHVYNCQHCVSYTLQSNRYQMEWNGNGACRPAANPGTNAPGLPSWCRHWHWGPETTRPNRGSGAPRWNFGQPIPRWAAVARPKVGAPG